MTSETQSSLPSITEWRADVAFRRLDLFLAAKGLSPSRSLIQRLIRGGGVTVNGRPAEPSMTLRAGDLVRVEAPEPEQSELQPEAISLFVVYEDQDVAVIDKPAGLVVHPGAGCSSGTLVNALLARWPSLASTGSVLRPGIVHRLDKDTSGLMVIAKNEAAYLDLSRQIKAREIHKEYLALANGALRPAKGRIEAPIGRDPRNRKRMAVVERGHAATTEYHVLEYLSGYSLLKVITITGRTHQIRVHLAAVGHPLLGDTLYGGKSPLLDRQFLHACLLGFRLPQTGDYREFQSPLPPDLETVLSGLRESNK